MCGITGFMTNGKYKFGEADRRDYLRQSLFVDSLRGYDSTGVFYGLHGKKNRSRIGWAKDVLPGSDFVFSKNYLEIEKFVDEMWFAVGHNRWATVGKTDEVENAHPFAEGPIVMVHNGTLHGDGGLITTQRQLKVDVDSHALCHNFALHDAKEVLEDISGAYALVWWDRRDQSLNFARNTQRPLWFAGNTSQMFFASERGMLEWLIERNKISLGHNPTVAQLPVREIHKYKKGSLNPEVIDIPYASQYGGSGYSWNYYERQHGQGQQGGGAVKKPANAKGNNGTSGGKNSSGGGSSASGTSSTVHHVVPDCVNELLNTQGFDKTDRLPMKALGHVGKCTYGHLEAFDMAAFVLGVPSKTFEDYKDKEWKVRPVGLRILPNSKTGADEHVLMCRVVKFGWDTRTDWEYGAGWDNVVEKEEAAKKAAKKGDSDAPKEESKSADIYRLPAPPDNQNTTGRESTRRRVFNGPGGSKVGKSNWLDKTMRGCSVCSCLPRPDEHAELLWLDDGFDSFVCKSCQGKHIGND